MSDDLVYGTYQTFALTCECGHTTVGTAYAQVKRAHDEHKCFENWRFIPESRATEREARRPNREKD